MAKIAVQDHGLEVIRKAVEDSVDGLRYDFRFVLVDGNGTSQKLKISSEGALHAIVHPHPPPDEESTAIPYQQEFKNDSNSSDMRVDGSVTTKQFFISANSTYDTYIHGISIVIADAGSSLNKFGNLDALANGLVLSWVTEDLGTQVIATSITTNFKLIRLALGYPAFGSGTAAFLASNVSGTSEAYLPVINFVSMYGLPWGLRLKKNTTDKIIWTVRDNITGLDQFDAIAYGIKI